MRKKEQLAATVRVPPEQLALDFSGPAPAGPLFPRAELPRDPAERGHRAFESEGEADAREGERRAMRHGEGPGLGSTLTRFRSSRRGKGDAVNGERERGRPTTAGELMS